MTASFTVLLKARRFLRIAHRGASAYAPENTLPAFELACAQGADVLELDVHLTRDGEVVVIHDERVDRTTDGRGAVRALTLAEIRALDAGAWFGPDWRGARVPLLREVLERFAGRALIDIEIKGGVASDWLGGSVNEDPEVSTRLTRRVVEVLTQTGATERVIVSSFGTGALACAREIAPQVPTQWSVLATEVSNDCAVAAAAGFEVLSPQIYAATQANVATAHEHGLAIYVYAGGSEEAVERLLNLGVDAVKTDRPDRLSALMARRARVPSPGPGN